MSAIIHQRLVAMRREHMGFVYTFSGDLYYCPEYCHWSLWSLWSWLALVLRGCPVWSTEVVRLAPKIQHILGSDPLNSWSWFPDFEFLILIFDSWFLYLKPGGGGNAIYVPYGDVPPIRVYFLAFESETGCLFSSLTLKQGAKFVRSIRARVPIHSTVWHPHVGFNLFVFCSGN